MKKMTKASQPDDADDCDNDPEQVWNEYCAKLTSAARSAMAREEQDKVAGNSHSQPDRIGCRLRNGPAAKVRFYWNRKFIDLSDAPMRYRLLVALWDACAEHPHEERVEQDVIDEVWAHDNQTTHKNLKDLTYECNIRFRQKDIPLRIRRGCGKIWLENI